MRAVALALIRRDEEILVERGYDTAKTEMFYRLLGGTIEFGELGADAVRRELREELGVEIEVGPRIATIENIFTWEASPGTRSRSSTTAPPATQTFPRESG